jgi:hypothetical protein
VLRPRPNRLSPRSNPESFQLMYRLHCLFHSIPKSISYLCFKQNHRSTSIAFSNIRTQIPNISLPQTKPYVEHSPWNGTLGCSFESTEPARWSQITTASAPWTMTPGLAFLTAAFCNTHLLAILIYFCRVPNLYIPLHLMSYHLSR